MERWSGTILVLGLGTSGQAAAEWALGEAAAGADIRVVVADSARDEVLEERARTLRARGAEVRLGAVDVPPADLVVASPGVRPASRLMEAARSTGAPVISEIELANRISSAAWVAVTGTNGKTTTTALIAHVLREAGFPAEPVGNYGPPAVRAAAETGPAGVLVAEVSSFQLALVERFHARVAVLLNITPDHIDYHGSLEAYAGAKARVFANLERGDAAVIDVDDAGSAPYAEVVEGTGADVYRVSRSVPQERGAYLEAGRLMLADRGWIHGLLHVDDVPIKGHHNVSNALAAAAAAHAIGADPDSISRGLASFVPIEHRLEPAGIVDGAEYFNDSKATNPDAVVKALTAFEDRPVILLLGGRNKGVDMRPLAQIAAAECCDVVLFGEAASELEAAFAGLDARLTRVSGLADAVASARAIAGPGDVVLLSPGCASFDEFDDYTERGRRFKELVATMGEAG